MYTHLIKVLYAMANSNRPKTLLINLLKSKCNNNKMRGLNGICITRTCIIASYGVLYSQTADRNVVRYYFYLIRFIFICRIR